MRLEELTARLKAKVIAILKSQHQLNDLFEAANMARSTYFYHQERLNQPDKHAELKETIIAIFNGLMQRYGLSPRAL